MKTAHKLIFIVVPCILLLSKSFHFTNWWTTYLFSSTLKFTSKFTLKLLLHVSV